MIGHNVFDQMVTETTTTRVRFTNHISQDDFEQWKKDFTFDALYGLRYGQSFCNKFNITDNLLYYNPWPLDQTIEYIEKNYVDRS
jgi:hypothetical protein